MDERSSWLVLVLSLPGSAATARMRIWRTLKQLGAAALRDGVYLAPATAGMSGQLERLRTDTANEGGEATLLQAQAYSEADEARYRALFDRSAEYAAFMQAITEARGAVATVPAQELNRLLRRMRRDYEALRALDFFPGEAARTAELAWADFVQAAEQAISPGEPRGAHGPVGPRERARYQGKRWATRRRIWVDRVASAWLIRRFVDADARFVWLESVRDCPQDAVGFDYDGAEFTHAGRLVTFEVLVKSFGLEGDPGLCGLGAMVHLLDAGDGMVPEAKGFEAVLAGARQRRGDDDDAVLAEISPVLDALHAYFSLQTH